MRLESLAAPTFGTLFLEPRLPRDGLEPHNLALAATLWIRAEMERASSHLEICLSCRVGMPAAYLASDQFASTGAAEGTCGNKRLLRMDGNNTWLLGHVPRRIGSADDFSRRGV